MHFYSHYFYACTPLIYFLECNNHSTGARLVETIDERAERCGGFAREVVREAQQASAETRQPRALRLGESGHGQWCLASSHGGNHRHGSTLLK